MRALVLLLGLGLSAVAIAGDVTTSGRVRPKRLTTTPPSTVVSAQTETIANAIRTLQTVLPPGWRVKVQGGPPAFTCGDRLEELAADLDDAAQEARDLASTCR